MNVWGVVQARNTSDTYDEIMARRDSAKVKYYVAGGLYAVSAGMILAGILIPEHPKGVASVLPVRGGAIAGWTVSF